MLLGSYSTWIKDLVLNTLFWTSFEKTNYLLGILSCWLQLKLQWTTPPCTNSQWDLMHTIGRSLVYIGTPHRDGHIISSTLWSNGLLCPFRHGVLFGNISQGLPRNDVLKSEYGISILFLCFFVSFQVRANLPTCERVSYHKALDVLVENLEWHSILKYCFFPLPRCVVGVIFYILIWTSNRMKDLSRCFFFQKKQYQLSNPSKKS